MLFSDCRIPYKRKVLEENRDEIISLIEKQLFNFKDLNYYTLSDYVTELLLESEYDPGNECFIEPITNDRIDNRRFAMMVLNNIKENMCEFQ